MHSTVPARTATDQHIDWRSRCNLAASILNQRDPSALAARLATAALAGASADALLTIQKTGEK